MSPGAAMLPLTPPNELSDLVDAIAGAVDRDNGVSLAVSSEWSSQQTTIATPTSLGSMGLDDMDGRSDMEEDINSQSLSDENQDMSDGGVELEMMISQNDGHQDLNVEMDMLDAEIIGNQNLLFHDSHLPPGSHYPPTMDDDVPFYYTEPFHEEEQFAQLSEDDSNYTMDDGSMVDAPYPLPTPGLPTVMSELSEQLQHIQDGQEHTDFSSVSDTPNGAQDNSTLPLPFVSLSFSAGGTSLNAQIESVHPSHQQEEHGNLPEEMPQLLTPPFGNIGLFQTHDTIFFSPFHTSDVLGSDASSEADQNEVEDQFNLSLGDFLYAWGRSALREEEPRRRIRGPSLPAASRQRDLRFLEPMTTSDLQGDKCDIQRIDWNELGVSRLEARHMRRQTYKNYTNLRLPNRSQPKISGARMSTDEDYFAFRRMDFDHDVHLSHFQLRNLLACATRDHVYYAGVSKVIHYSPMEGNGKSDRYSVAMDLTQPTAQPIHGNHTGGVQISTMTIEHNILVAGGFYGEYGITNLRAHKNSKHSEGIITDDQNAITNHVQVHLSRSSSLPLAAFASNDRAIRILDIETNKFIAEHKYEHAINCSAISPDQRLRVLTGDCRRVMICNAETGEILQELEGHRDYGFACDWADDGWTVATGNQDMQVKIWDARKWTDSSGAAYPVATILAEMAGVRKLKFSPLGSGKKVLVAAEPADIVNVINAESFTSKQTLTFFGEIGGVDFANNGSDLIVANCDSMRGGIMEFERCGLANEAYFELGGEDGWRERRKWPRTVQEYDWMSNEDVLQHPTSRGTRTNRTRKPGTSGTTMGAF